MLCCDIWAWLFAVRCVLLLLQAATMRPTARYLQQHRFVVGQRPSNASCLLQLVEKVRAGRGGGACGLSFLLRQSACCRKELCWFLCLLMMLYTLPDTPLCTRIRQPRCWVRSTGHVL